MSLPSDSELHQLVQQIVRRTLEGAAGLPRGEMPDDDAFVPPPALNSKAVPTEAPPKTAGGPGGKIAIGADHGGFALKEELKAYLIEQGYNVVDCGTHSTDSVDYPDFASAVARLVGRGEVWRGIMVDGAGIGSCMAANKIRGVRAAMCYDNATAVNSREHNNANLLTLGAGLIGPNLARQITDTWLKTEFGGGRHARRVDKISALEE